MKKIISVLLPLLILFTISCNKEENKDTPAASGTYSISIAGQIKGENGLPLVNASVQVGSKTALTDNNGIFLIEKVSVPKGRAVVKANKAGYWDRTVGFIPNTGSIQYCNIVMPQKINSPAIQSATGGTITSSGATLTFPPNAFVTATGSTYSGMVTVTAKHLPVNDPNFGTLIPGGDLMAESTSGDIVKLESYGMIGVEIRDNLGNTLQLAPGKPATIQLPIDAGQLAGAAATIPLWYFDESKNMWVEEGFATKQGNNYIGEVAHFSWWNCDEPFPPATIQGYVYDCYGSPLANALIYNGNIGGVYTNQTGFYSGQVTSTIASSLYAAFGSSISGTITIPALTAGQLYNVPDLTINCNDLGKVKMKFAGCDGLPVNPLVFITNGTSFKYLIPANGVVNEIAPCGNITIEARNGSAQYLNTFNQLCYPDSTDLGNIVLCNTSPNSIRPKFFEMYLSSPSLNISYVDTVSVIGTYSSINNSLNFVSSISPNHYYDCLFEGFFTYVPGTYLMQNLPFQNFDIVYGQGNTEYFISPDSIVSGPTLTILKNGLVGDTMEVFIQGAVTVFNSNTTTFEQGVIDSLKIKCIRN